MLHSYFSFQRGKKHLLPVSGVSFKCSCSVDVLIVPKAERHINHSRALTSPTCLTFHVPKWQVGLISVCVEHTHVLRDKQLYKPGGVQHFLLTVQNGCSLLRNMHYASRKQGEHSHKRVLENKHGQRQFSLKAVQKYGKK